jgi:Fe-S-cluster-containing dehydrogenase component
VASCPVDALSVSKKTAAVLVDAEKCIACGKCIVACPGRIPHLHPKDKRVVICDLCNGDPQCVKVCREGSWDVLRTVSRKGENYGLYARRPEEVTRDLAAKIYGEEAEEYL